MKTIGVFFGSRSPEHDISIITAQMIISGIKGIGMKVIPVYINKKGEWLISEKLGELKAFTEKEDLSSDNNFKRYFLDLENSKGKIVLKSKGIRGRTIDIDIAFPAFHGSFGEDGTIQGFFEMLSVPYIGCNIASSAISMDKILTKQLCQANNIPITKYLSFSKNQWEENKSKILGHIKKELKVPYFAKPAHLGSSIGISKIEDFSELEEKIEVALFYDDKVLVEEGIYPVVDITCAIIGNEKLKVSLLQESKFNAKFFDFHEKYITGGGKQFGKQESALIIPANIDAKTTENIQRSAKVIFKAVGCKGIARIDFLLDKKTDKFFTNEINPLPGTLYHHLWQKSGITLSELLEKLVELAVQEHRRKQKINYVFPSSVLKNLNFNKIKGGNKLK